MYSVRVVPSKQHTCRYNRTEEDKELQALANLIHSFGNKELISLLSITLNYVVFCSKGFILPLCVLDGLCYFLVALPEPSI